MKARGFGKPLTQERLWAGTYIRIAYTLGEAVAKSGTVVCQLESAPDLTRLRRRTQPRSFASYDRFLAEL